MTGAHDAHRRNYSPYEWFLETARSNEPAHRFRPGRDFENWRETTLPAVLQTLGRLPDRVDPCPELTAEWEQHGVVRQRWAIDVQQGLSAVAYVNRPTTGAETDRRPGILCWHGHTGFGKEPAMGNSSTAEIRAYVADTNTTYGLEMAKAGFVTFAIDWMGQGQRDDSLKPNHRAVGDGDSCDLYYLYATMLGLTPLGMNLMHGLALLDFASSLPFVDENQLGVMGESYGGTLSLWTTLLDTRIKATEIICYSDLFADFGFRDANFCGSQITPGLLQLVDVPELQGLIAPRPLLVDIGAHDDCFLVDSAMECHRQVQSIYEAAGSTKMLELDLFPGGHGWIGSKSVPFFSQHLGVSGD